MAAVQIEVSNIDERNSIELITTYCGVSDKTSITEGPCLMLRCGPSGQDTLTGPNTICRYLADMSIRKTELLGNDAGTAAQIMQWLSFKNLGLSPITEEKLALISDHLLTRMYLVDNLSLADLCLFSKLHRALSHLPAAQTARYCNLIRWFDHLQHTADLSGVYTRIHFARPSLPEPPQPPTKAPQQVPASQAGGKGPSASKPSADSSSSVQKPAAEKSDADTSAFKAASESAAKQDAPASNGAATPSPAATTASASKDAKQAKKEARKEARKEAEPKKAEEVRIDMLDIRVGQIVEIGPHPNADALYVEQIDLGEDKPRQVVSGLRNFIPIEQMQGRRVVVCTNLKPAKMRDVMSYGMVLCASNAGHDKVDPLKPPEGAKNGDRINFPGYDQEPLAEINPKKKILEKLKEDLATDSVGVATYKAVPFMCSGSPVVSKLPSASVG